MSPRDKPLSYRLQNSYEQKYSPLVFFVQLGDASTNLRINSSLPRIVKQRKVGALVLNPCEPEFARQFLEPLLFVLPQILCLPRRNILDDPCDCRFNNTEAFSVPPDVLRRAPAATVVVVTAGGRNNWRRRRRGLACGRIVAGIAARKPRWVVGAVGRHIRSLLPLPRDFPRP